MHLIIEKCDKGKGKLDRIACLLDYQGDTRNINIIPMTPRCHADVGDAPAWFAPYRAYPSHPHSANMPFAE